MKNLMYRAVLGVGCLWLSVGFAQNLTPNIKAAEGKVSMCMGCHGIPGYRIAYPKIYSVPKLGGQNAKYLESALWAYKKGDRSHPTMRAIAETLTEQDIVDIAAYYAQPAK
jgi:cytochrome c553